METNKIEGDLARAISLIQELDSHKDLYDRKMALTEIALILEDRADDIYQELALVDEAIIEEPSEETPEQDYVRTELKALTR